MSATIANDLWGANVAPEAVYAFSRVDTAGQPYTGPIGRNAIGDRTPGLTPNADGSLDLHVQNAGPRGSQGNWLPSPTGAFVLLLRLYLPLPSVLGGTYVYPSVTAE